MMYANREPLASARALGVDEPIASANAAWSSGGAAACRRRPARAPRRRPRRRRAPTRRPGSGPAARARAARRRLAAAPPPCAASSSFSSAAASIFACRSSGAALPISFDAAFWRGAQLLDLLDAARGARRRAASTSSIRPARTRLRSMPRRYSGSSRSRLRSITPSSSRICARSASTHADACFHAVPAGRAALDAGLGRAADRIRAEELHLGLLRREVAQRVGDQLVGDVAFAVDEEAVVAEAALRRPRLELREVDRTRRELLEDREQRTRAVLALEADDRRLVVAGRRGDAAADEHEAGLVLGMVLDLGREHLEPVELGRERVADRGEVACASTSRPRAPRRRWSATRAVSAAGSFFASQPRHCAIACGNDTTVRTSASADAGPARTGSARPAGRSPAGSAARCRRRACRA